VFFNDSNSFAWEKPETLVDARSGVICCPSNFQYTEPTDESAVRVTVLANYDGWRNLPEDEYRLAKQYWYERMVESAVRWIPDFRKNVIDTDIFTPTTIQRFTGHINGAVYGSPHKQWDGRTPLRNLFVCGTDQGLVGIIGSMISGITIANRYLLRDGGLPSTPGPSA
jgi:phytoene dehydrogenase-like protein